ncbi:hypothetical protein VNO77_03228 [Canavalia gladiata]|uniref:Uncharacterized protein n=1 Tax=Canavalia gladiata TaxID=3824 RepID=A0AAN9MV01_CANGL
MFIGCLIKRLLEETKFSNTFSLEPATQRTLPPSVLRVFLIVESKVRKGDTAALVKAPPTELLLDHYPRIPNSVEEGDLGARGEHADKNQKHGAWLSTKNCIYTCIGLDQTMFIDASSTVSHLSLLRSGNNRAQVWQGI